mmetsp:Transcript_21833/g.47542  ORF Transcript_21833/g.47542 Transcript_21833/m.47542 type:complete len:80 (+) Transcript_21833:935-1174(+)
MGANGATAKAGCLFVVQIINAAAVLDVVVVNNSRIADLLSVVIIPNADTSVGADISAMEKMPMDDHRNDELCILRYDIQ